MNSPFIGAGMAAFLGENMKNLATDPVYNSWPTHIPKREVIRVADPVKKAARKRQKKARSITRHKHK